MERAARKILVVESNPAKRAHLLDLCRAPSAGPFDVDICTSVRDAATRLSASDYDACLLPNEPSLLQDARRASTETLLLLISDDDSPERDSAAIDGGADDILPRESLNADALTRALINAERRRSSGEKLHQMARQDPLTGLGNRALLESELDRMILRGQRSPTGFALLYIDLDYFKQINDTFGHGLGDPVEYGVHDLFHIALIEMRVLIRDLLDQFGSNHLRPPSPGRHPRKRGVTGEKGGLL